MFSACDCVLGRHPSDLVRGIMNIAIYCYCVCVESVFIYISCTLAESYISDVKFESIVDGNSGKVAIQYNHTWYQLCQSDEDNNIEANIICHQLGYLGGWSRSHEDPDAHGIEIECGSRDAESLEDCDLVTDPQKCLLNITLGVWCFKSYISDVKFESIVDGNSGKVAIQYNHTWYQLCQSDEDNNIEANIICHQLGYLGGWSRSHEDPDAHGIEIECGSRDAESLEDCDLVTDPQKCLLNITLGVWCFNHTSVHLADSPPDRPHIGRVQVQYDSMLTEVCFTGRDNVQWTYNSMANLKVLCRQLGYPGALTTSQYTLAGNNDTISNIYTDSYKCHSGDEGVYQCLPGNPTNGACTDNVYVHAVCAAPGYVGCFGGKSIAWKTVNDTGPRDDMSIPSCIGECQNFPETIRYVGLQGGDRCICISGEIDGDEALDDLECDLKCQGDEYDICGSGSRVSIYKAKQNETMTTQTSHTDTPNTEIPRTKGKLAGITDSSISAESKQHSSPIGDIIGVIAIVAILVIIFFVVLGIIYCILKCRKTE